METIKIVQNGGTPWRYIVFAAIVLFLITPIVTLTGAEDSNGPLITIQDCNILPTKNTTISIAIKNIDNVDSAQVNLTFNPAVIHVSMVHDSDFDSIFQYINNTAGRVNVGVFQISGTLSGAVHLANLTLEAVGPVGATSFLNFTQVEVYNGSQLISVTIQNGTAMISEDQDITPPKISNINAYPTIQEVGGFVNISCSVTDNVAVHTVKANRIYPNGSMFNATMFEDSSYYYAATYMQVGEYTYFIWANDTNGNSNTSLSYSFRINGSRHPPTVEITSPQDGAIVNGTIVIHGKASDVDGNETVQKVEVRIDEREWTTANNIISWNYAWNTMEFDNGDYTIQARSYDGTNYSTVESITVTIERNEDSATAGFQSVLLLVATIVAAIIFEKRYRSI